MNREMDNLLTLREAAFLLAISELTLRNWLKSDNPPPFIRLVNGRYRFDRNALLQWATRKQQSSNRTAGTKERTVL